MKTSFDINVFSLDVNFHSIVKTKRHFSNNVWYVRFLKTIIIQSLQIFWRCFLILEDILEIISMLIYFWHMLSVQSSKLEPPYCIKPHWPSLHHTYSMRRTIFIYNKLIYICFYKKGYERNTNNWIKSQ